MTEDGWLAAARGFLWGQMKQHYFVGRFCRLHSGTFCWKYSISIPCNVGAEPGVQFVLRRTGSRVVGQ
jgi:hypothetical protein